jgi:hypothetical protein
VVTHLFADGGRVVKSTKTSYAHLVGEADLAEKVRAMMKKQHGAMLLSLRVGELDTLLDALEQSAGTGPEAPATAPRDGATEHPSEPIELRERAADRGRAPDDAPPPPAELPREPARRPQTSPGTEESPGSYRFVGQTRRRTNPDVPPSQPPPPATRKTGSGVEAAVGLKRTQPDAVGEAQGTGVPKRTQPDAAPGPDDDEDLVQTGVFERPPNKRQTRPEPAAARSFAARETGFGAAHISERSFDQLVLELLTSLHAR